MVIIGKPKNENDFIMVDKLIAKKLHSFGYQPIYRNKDNVYFVKNKEIEEVVKNWNLKIK